MRSARWDDGRTARRGWARLLGRPMSRRTGMRAGVLGIAGLLVAVVAGGGEGEDEEEDDDD